MKKTLQIVNIVVFAITIFMNYASSAGLFNGATQAEISAKYSNMFTPAGYAFSIWGLIYLLLFGFVIYQSRSLVVKVRDDDFIQKTGWWFVLSCLANSLWCYLFVSDYILASVITIFFLLFCLLKIIYKNSMELWDAPISVIVCIWWPFVFYSGWLTVACIANVSVYLTKIEWTAFGLSPQFWTIVMIVIATGINLAITWTRNMREFALVGAWAIVAIGVANYNIEETVVYCALITGGLLLVSSSVHAIKNKDTSPYQKCLEYLNKEPNS